MADTTAKQGDQRRLEALLGSALESGIDALASLVGQDVKCRMRGFQSLEPRDLLGRLDGQHAVVCGALDRAYKGHSVRVVIPSRDATTLSGYVMMAPEPAIEDRRRTGLLEGEELETFAEVANVLCSAFDAVLKESLGGDVALRAQSSGTIAPGEAESDLLGHEPLAAFAFELSVGGHPQSQGWLLLDAATAERWNGGALRAAAPAGSERPGHGQDHGQGRGAKVEEEIPAAPIRGRLTAYLVDQDLLDEVRKSGRRVGLEVDRRARSEVPNPAEHKDGVVLMDIPPGDARRFEWCKRLKQYQPAVKVVLLIHHPSRSQVLRGFLAQADAILACPIAEAELSRKLEALLDSADG